MVLNKRAFSPVNAFQTLHQLSYLSPRPMSPHGVPNEIWLYIFELATAEYLPDGELPNSMDKSAWFKNVFGLWCLQSPNELTMNAQKKRHKTVKVRGTGFVEVRDSDWRGALRLSSPLANVGTTSLVNSYSTTSRSLDHPSCNPYTAFWVTNLIWAHTPGISTSAVPRFLRQNLLRSSSPSSNTARTSIP